VLGRRPESAVDFPAEPARNSIAERALCRPALVGNGKNIALLWSERYGAP
jgi:hypothetical protein